MHLKYSILVGVPVIALALAQSANAWTMHMRFGTGNPGTYAAPKPWFGKTASDDPVTSDSSDQHDSATRNQSRDRAVPISPPSCPAVYLCNSAEQCHWERAC